MRFPCLFKRVKPAAGGSITLGADTIPATKPTATADNVLIARAVSTNGYPIKRVALAGAIFGNGGTPPAALPVFAYVWDDAIGFWLACTGSATTLTPGNTTSAPVTPQTPVYFDIPSLADPPATAASQAAGSLGNLMVLFIVNDATSANGTYLFSAAPVLNEKSL